MRQFGAKALDLSMDMCNLSKFARNFGHGASLSVSSEFPGGGGVWLSAGQQDCGRAGPRGGKGGGGTWPGHCQSSWTSVDAHLVSKFAMRQCR